MQCASSRKQRPCRYRHDYGKEERFDGKLNGFFAGEIRSG